MQRPLLVLALCAGSSAHATERLVNPILPNAYRSFSAAAADAVDGDVIRVGVGDWSENRVTISASVTIESVSGDPSNTTIPPIRFSGGEHTVRNVTLGCVDVAARTPNTVEGPMYLLDTGATATFDNVISDGCQTEFSSEFLTRSTLFQVNLASDLTVLNSRFVNNAHDQGVMYFNEGSTGAIQYNRFENNSSVNGAAAVWSNGAELIIDFNDFIGNTSDHSTVYKAPGFLPGDTDLYSNFFCGNATTSPDPYPSDINLSETFSPVLWGNIHALNDGPWAVRIDEVESRAYMRYATFAGMQQDGVYLGDGVTYFEYSGLLVSDVPGEFIDGSNANITVTGDGFGYFNVNSWSSLYGLPQNASYVEADPMFLSFTSLSTCDDLNLWLDRDSPFRASRDDNAHTGAFADHDHTRLADADGDTKLEDIDCDETDATIYPGATETPYDGIDQDCDGADLTDVDGDGHDAEIVGGDDCNDNDATISPSAAEIWYDGIDQDCDQADDYDQDGDGYVPDAYASVYDGDLPLGDCDDTRADAYPGAPETWYDGVDQNCDGASDYDQDGDGADSDAHGGTDCDDEDDTINPAATEVWYDGIDQDCDDASDYDQDGDGADSDLYGGEDCDDEDGGIGPQANEIWYDGIDQDCDRQSDYDQDGDGVDAATEGGDDCDDTDASIYPGADDIADNGIDEDCTGSDATTGGGGTGETEDEKKGCGCSAASTAPSGWLVAGLPLLGLARRRRQVAP